RKHKVEGPKEGDSCEKMPKKTKLKTQQDTLNEKNKENMAYLLPLLEQTENLASIETKEKHNIMNTNIEKHNWDDMMKEETGNFKDITNTVNPWVDANSNETIVEKHDMVEETKSDNLQDGKPEGLEGLLDDCFFEHIEDMLDLSDHKSYEQPTSRWDKNMQMDVAPQEQGKPNEMVEEKETALVEEAAITPTAEGSPTGEENIPTIEPAAPPVPTALPKEESTLMVAEPIKDVLATVYGESKEQKIPQSIPVERDTRIEEIQTNMFSQ
ncbi:38697_t:CDS:2, partial [Gigaspora margarita]